VTGECPVGRGHRFESGWGESPRGFESLTLRTLPIHGGSPVPEVVIDGVRYIAESDLPTPPWYDDPEQAPHIGIGITTLNRPDFLAATTKAFEGKLPAGAELVVVDDGSAKPAKVPNGWTLHRFPENRGVPSAKNKCIEPLYPACVDYFFLFDDDGYPTPRAWLVPYVAPPLTNLQYQMEPAPHHWAIREIRSDGRHRVSGLSRGPMLYFTRKVDDEVGG